MARPVKFSTAPKTTANTPKASVKAATAVRAGGDTSFNFGYNVSSKKKGGGAGGS